MRNLANYKAHPLTPSLNNVYKLIINNLQIECKPKLKENNKMYFVLIFC